MLVITLQREKCIGCNYCVEVAPQQFQMSTKDGKTVLLKSKNNKGFHTLKTADSSLVEPCMLAQKICPVHIIKVKEL